MNCPFAILISLGPSHEHESVSIQCQSALEKVWRSNATRKLVYGDTTVIAMPPSSSKSEGIYRPPNEPDLLVIADGEILSKSDLIFQLQRSGSLSSEPVEDTEILFAAYKKWGDDFLSHVYGEFTLAIINLTTKEVSAFSDAFGVRPFYFCRFKTGLIVSTAIDVILAHPLLTPEANEDSLLDYLLFGTVQATDHSRTAFKHVHVLPASSKLTLNKERFDIKPIDVRGLHCVDDIKIHTGTDFARHFQDEFLKVINERTEEKNVKLLLSGGLDSGSIAVALSLLQQQGRGPRSVSAHTISRGYDDPEALGARAITDKLGFPHHVHQIDVTADVDQPPLVFPSSSPYLREQLRAHSSISEGGGQLMTGLGFDQLLNPEFLPIRKMIRQYGLKVSFDALSAEYSQKLAFVLSGQSTAEFLINKRRPDRDIDQDFYQGIPRWLDSSANSYDLWVERWHSLRSLGAQLPSGHLWQRHPLHPLGQRAILMMTWGQTPDPALESGYLNMCHPILDLRLIRLVWNALPRPWCNKKNLLRTTFAKSLPSLVKRAPKRVISSKLQGENLNTRVLKVHPRIEHFVREDYFSCQSLAWSSDLRPLLLSNWLAKRFG